jgi:hypothetical protein
MISQQVGQYAAYAYACQPVLCAGRHPGQYAESLLAVCICHCWTERRLYK